MQIHVTGENIALRRALLAGVLFLCLLMPGFLAGADSFSIAPRGSMSAYGENIFWVCVPEAGELQLEIADEDNLYRVLEQRVDQGENEIPWDGLGVNQERLNKKVYTVRGKMKADSGRTYEAECMLNLETSSQALVYALPSSDRVYTEQKEDWFVELKMMLTDELVAEFYAPEGEEPLLTLRRTFSGGRVSTCSLRSLLNGREIEPGSYRVRMYALGNPRYSSEFDLLVLSGSRPVRPVEVTGSVMPGENASDAEIWEKMMMPSVVVDIKPTSHQKVYAERDEKSASLGTLHGQSQGVEVLEIREDWALISAWNHESASPVTGWVPLRVLKVEEPQGEYALLLDKRQQTLTLFRRGERVDTLLVSTGRAEKNELYQETAAGCFLTDLHRADFSTNGLKYDYVIRYDGGNLLHQIPYAWGNDRKDYLAGEVYLGTKASHACVRIQAKAGENGINAYWLWTHLPYHTRLIILDDPEERQGLADLVQGRTAELDSRLNGGWTVLEEEEPLSAEAVVLTFGGDAVLGGRESYYKNPEGFPAVVEKEGAGWPFSGLQSIFKGDDLTSVNLECVLKENSTGEDLTKSWRFRGLPSYGEILPLSSVEMVNLANNHTIDYGPEGYASTMENLEGRAAYSGNEINTLVTLKGHVFGFGGCRETTYLQDPGIIERDIESLRAMGAEYVIYQCHWGQEYSPNHSALQEAMARCCQRAGADLVVGHHPHVVQGIDYIGEMPVVYSLGNLVFGGTIQLRTYEGLLVQAVFDPDNKKRSPQLRLIPILTSSRAEERINDYRPVPARGGDWLRILQAVQADTPFSLTDRVRPVEP